MNLGNMNPQKITHDTISRKVEVGNETSIGREDEAYV